MKKGWKFYVTAFLCCVFFVGIGFFAAMVYLDSESLQAAEIRVSSKIHKKYEEKVGEMRKRIFELEDIVHSLQSDLVLEKTRTEAMKETLLLMQEGKKVRVEVTDPDSRRRRGLLWFSDQQEPNW